MKDIEYLLKRYKDLESYIKSQTYDMYAIITSCENFDEFKKKYSLHMQVQNEIVEFMLNSDQEDYDYYKEGYDRYREVLWKDIDDNYLAVETNIDNNNVRDNFTEYIPFVAIYTRIKGGKNKKTRKNLRK